MTNDPRRRATIEAADRLREAILAGDYRAGTSLPGERELSEQLGISRLTLRSALAHLETEGLVRPVHGSGTRVLDYRENGGVDLLSFLARMAVEGRTVPVGLLGDLLELRRAIAVEVVGMAAERVEPAELLAMRAQVARQHELLDRPREFMSADLHFARLMVRATHNLGFELLFNTVARVLERNASLELAYFTNAPQTLRVYARLLDILEKRESDRARRATAAALARLDRSTLARIATVTAVTRATLGSPPTETGAMPEAPPRTGALRGSPRRTRERTEP
jgi:GntR family transcriptional regulator, transcriptional repressor for pyruvate dehydrogenase complex